MSREHLRLPMHGRDHLPGGSDPIPGITSSSYSPKSAEEHFLIPSTTIGPVSTATLQWSHYSGSALVDLTTATNAKVTTSGVFACQAVITVDLPGGSSPGDGITFTLEAIQNTLPFAPGYPMPSSQGGVEPNDNLPPFAASAAIVALMVGNTDWFQMLVRNRTENTITVTASASIVRIVQTS